MRNALALLAVVASLVAPLLLAQEPAANTPNPLTGVTSVFINAADMTTKMEIRRILQRELPTRLDNRTREQIVFRGGGGGASGTASQPTTAVRLDQPTGPRMIVNGLSGVAVRGNVTLVVHHGVSSPLFPAQFANELVKAYREANPESEKK